MDRVSASEAKELPLFEGGPFERLLRAVRLYGAELRHHAGRRIVALVALTWLPLLLLSAWEGQAWGELARMPFFMDASAHVRFLFALPLLVLAEIGVDARIRPVPETFVQRGLVPPEELPRLRALIDRARQRRDSRLAEGVMLLMVCALAGWQVGGGHVGLEDLLLDGVSWHVLPAERGGGLSPAGLWFALVSLPVFQFLALRWYYRILVWAGLMWRVSRLELQLLPGHPDRFAGLGFISETVYAYVPLALAHGTMLSSVIVNRIFYSGAVLTDFRIEMVAMVLFVYLLLLAPLLVFAPALLAANLKATREFGALANGVARAFEARWIHDKTRQRSDLLDVGEVSAMTDLDTTVAIVREMHYVPVTRKGLLLVGVAVLAPLSPLLLTMMPADELIQRLVGMFV